MEMPTICSNEAVNIKDTLLHYCQTYNISHTLVNSLRPSDAYMRR